MSTLTGMRVLLLSPIKHTRYQLPPRLVPLQRERRHWYVAYPGLPCLPYPYDAF